MTKKNTLQKEFEDLLFEDQLINSLEVGKNGTFIRTTFNYKGNKISYIHYVAHKSLPFSISETKMEFTGVVIHETNSFYYLSSNYHVTYKFQNTISFENFVDLKSLTEDLNTRIKDSINDTILLTIPVDPDLNRYQQEEQSTNLTHHEKATIKEELYKKTETTPFRYPKFVSLDDMELVLNFILDENYYFEKTCTDYINNNKESHLKQYAFFEKKEDAKQRLSNDENFKIQFDILNSFNKEEVKTVTISYSDGISALDFKAPTASFNIHNDYIFSHYIVKKSERDTFNKLFDSQEISYENIQSIQFRKNILYKKKKP